MATRVAVFIDWQNCYHCARDAFHQGTGSSRYGNVRPKAFAELLCEKGPAGRELVFVGIYRGQPDPRKDPRTHAAHDRQRKGWEASGGGLVQVRSRGLRYPPGRPLVDAEEKGIDVQLAIDAMVMGVRGSFDVAVIATTDTDLLPVVEGLQALKAENLARAGSATPEVEVIGWQGLTQGLHHCGAPVRWIGVRDYAAVRDDTDYNLTAAERRPGGPPIGRY